MDSIILRQQVWGRAQHPVYSVSFGISAEHLGVAIAGDWAVWVKVEHNVFS